MKLTEEQLVVMLHLGIMCAQQASLIKQFLDSGVNVNSECHMYFPQMSVMEALFAPDLEDEDAMNLPFPTLRAIFSTQRDKLVEAMAKQKMDISHSEEFSDRGWMRHYSEEVKRAAQLEDFGVITYTLLHQAAKYGHVEAAKILLTQNKIKLNARNSANNTPLHLAARYGHSNLVNILLEQKEIELNAKNYFEETPLHHAIRSGHSELVDILLAQKGIDLNAQSNRHQTPLHLAVLGRYSKIVAMLLAQKGIELNAYDRKYCTPLHYAVRYNKQPNILKILLAQEGIKLNARDSNKETPLHYAVRYNQPNIIKILLAQEGIELNARDSHQETPLLKAVRLGEPDVLMMMCNKKLRKSYAENQSEQTSLKFEILELLLAQEGIELDIRKPGYEALRIAAKTHKFEVVKEIIKRFIEVPGGSDLILNLAQYYQVRNENITQDMQCAQYCYSILAKSDNNEARKKANEFFMSNAREDAGRGEQIELSETDKILNALNEIVRNRMYVDDTKLFTIIKKIQDILEKNKSSNKKFKAVNNAMLFESYHLGLIGTQIELVDAITKKELSALEKMAMNLSKRALEYQQQTGQAENFFELLHEIISEKNNSFWKEENCIDLMDELRAIVASERTNEHEKMEAIKIIAAKILNSSNITSFFPGKISLIRTQLCQALFKLDATALFLFQEQRLLQRETAKMDI